MAWAYSFHFVSVNSRCSNAYAGDCWYINPRFVDLDSALFSMRYIPAAKGNTYAHHLELEVTPFFFFEVPFCLLPGKVVLLHLPWR